MIENLTAREMRSINPTHDMLHEAFEYLINLGWKPITDPRDDKPVYTFGWWVHPDHPTKCRPVGGSKNFHFGAWDTIATYVAPENQ